MGQYTQHILPQVSKEDEIPFTTSVGEEVKKHYALGMICDGPAGVRYVKNFTEPTLYATRREAEQAAKQKTYQYGKPFIIYEAVAVVERLYPEANLTLIKG